MKHFHNKIAIVTGGASGIGFALAELLLEHGATVILADIDEATLHNAYEKLRHQGEVALQVIDVRNAESVRSAVQAVVDEYGRLDLLFNNAGINIIADLLETTLEDWRRIVDINLMGVVHGIDAAYPIMVEQGHGHIINTASAQGLAPIPAASAYTATKFAVTGLSNALRAEAAGRGVKVSVACPGFVDTPIRDNAKYVSITKEEFVKQTVIPPLHPSKCARVILRGVARNKAIIPISAETRLAWWAYRLFPNLMIWVAGKVYGKRFAKG